MRPFVSAVLALTLAAPLRAQEPKPAADQAKAKAGAAELATDDSQALYLLGAILAQQAADFALAPADLKFVRMGLEDFVRNAGQLQVDHAAVNPKLNALRQARMAKRSEKEKKKGQEFAAQAAKEKGAEKTSSGMIYISIKEGMGASPKATDKVKVHYIGTFIDGKVFDSSVQRDQPAEFPLNGVIACWTEGVQKLKVGGKAKLVCPPEIAYGDQGRPSIPGGSTLVFEVELLDILK